MAPFRKPLFSQGSAWLPTWLVSSPLHTGVLCFDTPSIFATNCKDEELPLTSSMKAASSLVFRDLTNRVHEPLCLSEEQLTGEATKHLDSKNTVMNEYLCSEQHKAFVLQLSLSPREIAVDVSSIGDEKRLEMGPFTKATQHGLSSFQVLPHQHSLDKHNGSRMEIEPSMKVIQQEPPSLENQKDQISLDEHDGGGGDMEAGLKTVQKEPPFLGSLSDQASLCGLLDGLDEKGIAAELPCRNDNNNVPGDTQVISCKCSNKEDIETSFGGSGLTYKPSKKVKRSSSTISMEDVQSAIGLMVATAEALAVADIMTNCKACQSLGPNAILDAALSLKRERELCGLGDFTMDCPHASEDACNEGWTEGLDDSSLEKEYLIVNLSETSIQRHNDNTCINITIDARHGEPEKEMVDPNDEEDAFEDHDNHNLEPHGNPTPHCMILSKSFNSRWLGGWTGVGYDLETWEEAKQRSHDRILPFEMNNLSEDCGVIVPTDVVQRGTCIAQKGSLPFNTVDHNLNSGANDDSETITSGSCAKILITMSQASVKCSSSTIQDPLCSFVPCSVASKVALASTDLANGGHTVEVAKEGSAVGEATKVTLAPQKCIQMPSGEHGLPCTGLQRKEQNCLKRYSTATTTFSPLLEAVRILSDEQDCMITCKKDMEKQKEEEQPFDDPEKPSDHIFADADIRRSRNYNEGEYQEKYEFQDSPLVWHRGKKRQRTCVIESAMIYDSDAACLGEMLVNQGPIMMEDTSAKQSKLKDYTGSIYQPCINVAQDASDHMEMMLDKYQKHSAYKLRERPYSELFKGLSFLLTGFPADQKVLCEDVSKKIEDNGGKLLASVPAFSTHKCTKAHKKCIIIVAPRKVRTLKFLYGCAIGSLIVKPKWVHECISAKVLLRNEQKSDTSVYHQGCEAPLFSKFEVFFHGQKDYCLKLSSLVKHGGGKVIRSLKLLAGQKKASPNLSQIVVVEHLSRMPGELRRTASKLALPIMSGDWIIESLLEGRLRPLQFISCENHTVNSIQHIASRLRPLKDTSDVKMKLSFKQSNLGITNNNNLQRSKIHWADHHYVSLLGKCMTTPRISKSSSSFKFMMPKDSMALLTAKRPYYTSICMDGVIFSAGDVVEIHPYTKEEKDAYVAQIERFYVGEKNGVNTKASQTECQKPVKLCFMWCRWFYRPSDTGFSMGTEKELYMSQHFDDGVPVRNIIKKASVSLIVDGKVYKNEIESGWKALPQISHYLHETVDYICRFFYDHKKESLHQLKSSFVP